MPVTVHSDAIVLREKLAQIQPFDPNPNFGSMPTVGNTPILESGSNANGNWIKYEDGTLICYHSVVMTTETTTTEGSVFRTAGTHWTYPLAFISPPEFTGGLIYSVYCWFGGGNGTNTTTTAFYAVYRGSAGTGFFPEVSLQAIGKWK